MVVQKDIAERLGVSRSAVSTILSGAPRADKFRAEFRQKVLATAAAMGYNCNELAQAVRTGQNRVIGLITQNIAHEHVGLVLSGINAVAAKHNYYTKIFSVSNDRDSSALARQCASQRLAGLIVYDIAEEDYLVSLHEALQELSIPILMAGGDLEKQVADCVFSDVRQGGRLALEYMQQLGHREILFVASYGWAGYMLKLQQGFCQAAAENDLKLTEKNFMIFQDCLEYEKVLQKIMGGKFSAVFCGNCYDALQIISALQNRGIRVPEDISILCRGEMHFCRRHVPGISTLDENLPLIGSLAAELLIKKRSKSGKKPILRYVAHKLQLRGSTAACVI